MTSSDFVCRLGAGFVDPFQVFPVKMDPPVQQALYRRELCLPLPPYLCVLYAVSKLKQDSDGTPYVVLDDSPSNRFRAYRDAWFPHALGDSAAFKQFLSTFSLHLQRVEPSTATEVGALTLTLHVQALRSVNERILVPTVAVDEGLLVAIMSFIAHYVCTSSPSITSSYEQLLTMAATAGELRCVADAYPRSQRFRPYSGRIRAGFLKQEGATNHAVLVS
jgi:hypothetical protein